MVKLLVEVDDFVEAARSMRHEVAENVQLCLEGVTGRLEAELVGVDPAGSSWAAEYDAAARSVLAASAQIIDGAYRTSQMFAASGRNYAVAEAASTTGGGARVGDWTQLLADQPATRSPSAPSAGGAGHDTPAGWWLVAHTVGYVWPDGHQDKLRRVADAWRSAATGIDNGAPTPLGIAASFIRDHLPEADGIIRVCQRFYDQLGQLADGYRSLADACDQYAEHLDACHDEIRSELEALLRDSVITQAAGAALSVVTLGLAEAPTQAAQAARVAAAAGRIGALIEKLLAAARTVAAGVRSVRALADEIKLAFEGLATTRLAYAGVTQVPRIERMAMAAARDGKSAAREAKAATSADRAGTEMARAPELPSALRGRKVGDPGVWAKPKSLNRHFKDHGDDVDAVDKADYASKASDFLQRALENGYPRRVDDEGIIRVYDPDTGLFGSYWPDGSARTFFRPDRPDYFTNQPGA